MRPANPFAHRPSLDGLRGIAAMLVVLFHLELTTFVGGYVGVDTFFVLSGFLITALLVRELGRTDRLDVVAFYARRARRLLPVSLLVLVVTAIGWRIWGTPLDIAQTRPGFLAAAAYVSNWWFIAEAADYFAQDHAVSPVMHYWSLSVEEQLYLVWPLALWGAWRLSRTWPRALWGVPLALAVASLAWSVAVAADQPMLSYFGTPARAWQLLAGALVALRTLHTKPGGPVLDGVAALALALLLGSVTPWGPEDPLWRGVVATLAAASLLESLERRQDGLLARMLSVAPLRTLGSWSYAIYLWHWPVIVIGDRGAWIPDVGPLRVLVVLALTLVLSWATFHLVERPTRHLRLATVARRRAVAASGVVGAAACIGVLLLALPVSEATRRLVALGDDGRAQAGKTEVFGLGGTSTVLLLGDSQEAAWRVALAPEAERGGWQLVARGVPACPWVPVELVPIDGRPDCDEALREPGLQLAEELRPEVVVLVTQAVLDRELADPTGPVSPVSPEGLDRVAEAATTYVDALRTLGAQVVLVTPIDPVEGSPRACLSAASDPSTCDGPASPAPGAPELVAIWERLAAAHDEVVVVDINPVLCPDGVCPAMVDDRVVRITADHLGLDHAATLGPSFATALRGAGVALP